MLVNHLPDQDPLMRGETLDVIIKRIAILSERDHSEVHVEVTNILKEKHEKELKKGTDSFVERMKRSWALDHCNYKISVDTPPDNREFLH